MLKQNTTQYDKTEFINRSLNALFVVALVSLPIAFFRIQSNGIISIFGFHLVLIAIAIATALFRNKLSYALKSSTIILISSSISVSSLFTFGFLAAGVPWLLMTLVFVFTLWPRYVRAAMVIAIAILIAAALGFISGFLTTPIDPNLMLAQPAFWLGLALPTFTFMAILLFELDANQKRLKHQKAELLEKNESLTFSASRDHITGVLNRKGFEDAVSYLFNSRSPIDISLIAIDIDYFKKINDTKGHDAGDLVLVKFAEMLTQQLRSQDILCRFGGEEFIVVTIRENNRSVENLCERLRKATEQMKIQLDDEEINITASFGVTHSNTSNSLTRLFRNSDKALYQAKEQGRNCIVFDELA